MLRSPVPTSGLLLAAAAAACGPPPHAKAPPDSGAGAAGSCAPLELHRAQTFEGAEIVEQSQLDAWFGLAGPGVAVADITGDGWLDVVLALPMTPSSIYLNDGAGVLTFFDIALPAANAISAMDVDDDGDIDLWLGRSGDAPDLLLRNDGDGQTWQQVELPGPAGESVGAAWADLDGDGDQDAVIARHFSALDWELAAAPGLTGGQNTLLIDVGDTFQSVGDALPPADPEGTVMAVPVDVDQDGDLDLFLSNAFGDRAQGSRWLINDGDVDFSAAPDPGDAAGRQSAGAAVADIDQDGTDDILLAGLGGPQLLEGDRSGAVVDTTARRGLDQLVGSDSEASWGSVLVDLDLDGGPELALAMGQVRLDPAASFAAYAGPAAPELTNPAQQPDRLLTLDSKGVFVDISAETGFTDAGLGRAVAVGDINRDGRPDLITAGLPFLQVWHGAGGCGPGITVAGLLPGDELEVQLGDTVRHQRHHPASAYSSSAPEVVVGLGTATRASRITLRSPGRAVEEWTEVAAGTVLRAAD